MSIGHCDFFNFYNFFSKQHFKNCLYKRTDKRLHLCHFSKRPLSHHVLGCLSIFNRKLWSHNALLCWHYPTTSKHYCLLEVQDKKVCQHTSTLLPNVRWQCSILLGQQHYLHNWLHLQPMEQGISGPKDEEQSICKFKAEYSCIPIVVPLSGISRGVWMKNCSSNFGWTFFTLYWH